MKTCQFCHKSFEHTEEDLRLFQKFGFEPTSECFDCNQKKRLAFRNERFLYTRTCDLTGEKMVSIYSPDKPYKVYSLKAWHSDQWDATEYGQDFDFGRPFFEQFNELFIKVPRMALVNVNPENSDYCNMCVDNQNCYLVFGGDFNQDVMYGTLCMRNRDSLDLDFSNNNELCYMLGDTVDSYGCQFVLDSKNCKNSYFLSDCIGCNDCILSTNLVNQSYCIENRQYSKEEYEVRRKELLNGSYASQQKLLQKFREMRKKGISKFAHIISSENCTGDYIKDSKNCHNCFDVSESEDLRNVIFASQAKDSFNTSLLGDKAELVYESFGIQGVNVQFSNFVIFSSDVQYSDTILNSQNCFGCSNLKQKKYCIFNKQYTKEDYEVLREKIIAHMKETGEWGQYFPQSMSPFVYPETAANAYFPMEKEESVTQGFRWGKVEAHVSRAEKTIPAHQLPDNIVDIPDDILNWAIVCEVSGKPFKINQKELKFYRTHNIPVPHLHPEERYKLRQSFRNVRRLCERQCAVCRTSFQTTFAPNASEKVLCEECYRKEVY